MSKHRLIVEMYQDRNVDYTRFTFEITEDGEDVVKGNINVTKRHGGIMDLVNSILKKTDQEPPECKHTDLTPLDDIYAKCNGCGKTIAGYK